MSNELQTLYANRFGDQLESKNAIWKVLCKHFFQRHIGSTGRVVDVAAGYCEWINNIDAKEKYAVDINPDTANYAGKDVKVVIGSVDALAGKRGYFDCVFISNFLEHLNSKEEVQSVLSSAWDLLRDGGRLLILQPNIKYTGGKYWDFIDHKTPLTELSLLEAVDIIRMNKNENITPLKKNILVIKKFLPYTTKSALPKSPWLIWVYLKLMPLSGLVFGEQSFLVFEK